MTVHNKKYQCYAFELFDQSVFFCLHSCVPARAVRNVGVLLFEHIVLLSPRAAAGVSAAAAPMMAEAAAEPVGSAGRRIHDLV